MDLIAALAAGEVFAFLLLFTRIGAAIMVLPGYGDSSVSPQIRLLLALLVTALVTPVLSPDLPPLPSMPIALFVLVVGELVIGLFLGLIARLLLSAIDVAGMVISFQLSLANAFMFNPTMAAQGSLVGAFLSLLAVLLLFVTDLHHLMLIAVIDSYSLFVPGEMPPMGDAAAMVARLVAESFRIGVQIAAPFLVFGLIFYLGLGVLARLMPQVQVFFVGIPIQIMLGLVVLALTLSTGMLYWLSIVQDRLTGFLAPV